jgi:hypothetical protein
MNYPPTTPCVKLDVTVGNHGCQQTCRLRTRFHIFCTGFRTQSLNLIAVSI